MKNDIITDEQIRALVDMGKCKDILPECVCHYTAQDNIKYIFKDWLSFKLTDINYFEDKNEGNLCLPFYHQALEEMKRTMEISVNDYNVLRDIEPGRIVCFFESTDKQADFAVKESVKTYIGCFSNDYNDKYMIEKYIKNDAHSGICIKLYTNEILGDVYRIGYYGYRVSFRKVIYGQDATFYFMSFIRKLLKITEGTKSAAFDEIGHGVLKSELIHSQWLIKAEKYRKEQEYRIILHTVEESPPNGYGHIFESVDNGILFRIRRNRLAECSLINMNDKECKEAQHIIGSMVPVSLMRV